MIILDTDHLTVFASHPGERRDRLVERIADSMEDDVWTTIISIEEQMRGWLDSIAKERQVKRQVRAYEELEALFRFFDEFSIAQFSVESASRFETIRKVRIGTMDLKIAAITLANDALLLTANRRDFEKVPGLKFENWLD